MTVFDMNNAVEAALHSIDKYAIYLRKSRADMDAEKHGEGETLSRHKKILLDLAVRKGLYIEKIYQEIVSGETIDARPEIQKLIADCYAGKYRGILVVEVTRLSRGNQGDAQTIMDCLKFGNNNNGVLVITPTKQYDVAHNPDDEEYMEFELFMSRREYKMIQKRMERGRRQAVVEGNYVNSARPYGFNIVKTKISRTLTPNEAEAPFVKMMYKWSAEECMSPGAIARKLTAMGVPTYTGKPEWSKDTVKAILTNPVYKGKVRWNDRMTVKTMVNGELVKSRPRSNHTEHYMEYDGKHKGLVDAETFKAATSRFKADKTKSGLKLINPLASILVCQNCGKALHYQAYKKANPRFAHPSSQICKVKSVIAQDVINAVVHCLRLYIEDFALKVDNLPTVDENAVAEQMKALQAELRKTEKKLAKVFDDYEEGIYTANEFVERKAKHTKGIETIKHQMEMLEDSIPERDEYEEKILGLEDALAALLDDTIDAADKNAFLKAVIDRIEFSRETGDEFIIDVFLK